MVECMAEHSVLVVGIYCGGRKTPPETVVETRDRFTHFMATLGATPFLPMQSDMDESSCTEGRGMLYLPFQFGTGRHRSLRYHDGIRLLHGEDSATATRAWAFREHVEHARDAKAAAQLAAKELARQKRALRHSDDKDQSMRSSSRESKRRLFLADEQTMGSASKYECVAFQLEKQWEHSCYNAGDSVLYLDHIVTLKGYDRTADTYSVQYQGRSGFFEAPACEVQPLEAARTATRTKRRTAARTSPSPPAKRARRTAAADTLRESTEERMAAMEKGHAEAMAAMGERMAAAAPEMAQLQEKVQYLHLALDTIMFR
jgi:hypothetical protein